MGLPVVVASNWGIAVTEASNGLGMRGDVATNGAGLAVTIVASGGLPIIFYGPDGTLWPGGVAPGGGSGGDGTMDFSNADDSGLIILLEDI